MSCRKRLAARLIGAAFVAMLGASCAEDGFFTSTPDGSQQTAILDHALNAARAARANGELSSAASKLAYLVSVAPDNVGTLSEYAKVLTEMGRPDDALVYFRKAIARDPSDWTLYNAEAVAYDEKHDYVAAASDYATALKLSPGQAVVLNNAARSRMAAGDLKGAGDLLAQTSPADRAQGFLAETQSHLTTLQAVQNPAARVASTAPKALQKTNVAANPGSPAALQAVPPAVSNAAPAPVGVDLEPSTRSPTASVKQTPAAISGVVPTAPATPESQAMPVALNTTSSWPSPAAPATSPTVIDASQEATPATETAKSDVPAPLPMPSSATPAPPQVLPSLAAKDEPKPGAASSADAKPVASAAIDAQGAASTRTLPATQTDNHRYYIRIGTFRSRKHARHVAARLRPRAVHVARLRYHGRHYYRVWFASADGRTEAESMLHSVQALGYRHARVIAKLQLPERRLADSQK